MAASGARTGIVPINEPDKPNEIDFGKGTRGLHHVQAGAKVFLPTFMERSVWEYFASRAKQEGVELPVLLTEILQRDIEINEAQT